MDECWSVTEQVPCPVGSRITPHPVELDDMFTPAKYFQRNMREFSRGQQCGQYILVTQHMNRSLAPFRLLTTLVCVRLKQLPPSFHQTIMLCGYPEYSRTKRFWENA